MGALDDASAPTEGRTGSLTDAPGLGPATLRLDDDPVDHGRVVVGQQPGTASTPDTTGLDPKSPPLAAGAEARGTSATDLWFRVRHLVQHPGSRTPAVTLVVVAALVGGLLGAGVAQRIALLAREQNASVTAWVGFGNASPETYNLFVVNSGSAPLTVKGADFSGGIDDDLAPIELVLDRPFEVAPGKVGQGIVTATSECDAGPLGRGGPRDGELQVTVATQDLREQVLSVPSLFSLSARSVDIYEVICGQDVYTPSVIPEFSSRADGRVTMTLRAEDNEDHEVDLDVPEGITLVTEPELPVLLESDRGLSIAIGMTVEDCTQNNQQLLAGQQITFVVDGRTTQMFTDTTPLLAWFAREVGKACG
jgi:hypothetical protein